MKEDQVLDMAPGVGVSTFQQTGTTFSACVGQILSWASIELVFLSALCLSGFECLFVD